MSTQATQEEKLWAQSILHTDERLLEALYVRRHEGRKKPEPRLLVVGQYQILLKKNKTKGVKSAAYYFDLRTVHRVRDNQVRLDFEGGTSIEFSLPRDRFDEVMETMLEALGLLVGGFPLYIQPSFSAEPETTAYDLPVVEAPMDGFSRIFDAYCLYAGTEIQHGLREFVEQSPAALHGELNLTSAVSLDLTKGGGVNLRPLMKTLQHSTWFHTFDFSDIARPDIVLGAASVVKDNARLETLCLCNTGANKGFDSLGMALESNDLCVLNSIDVSDNNVGDKGARGLAPGLRTLSTLITLDLSNCNIGSAGIQVLLEALGETPVANLNFSGNDFGTSGTASLTAFLNAHDTLVTLKVARANIDVASFAQSVSSCQLTALDLSQNELPAIATSALCDLLREQRTITKLWISKCRVAPRDAVSILDALSGRADVPENYYTADGIDFSGALAELGASLERNGDQLALLSLNACNLGAAGVCVVADGIIQHCFHIKHLKLSHNIQLSEGVNIDNAMIKIGFCMTELHLESVEIKGSAKKNYGVGRALMHVLNSAADSPSLLLLDVTNNGCGTDVARALKTLLESDCPLVSLACDGNGVDIQGLEMVTAAIEQNTTIISFKWPVEDLRAIMKAVAKQKKAQQRRVKQTLQELNNRLRSVLFENRSAHAETGDSNAFTKRGRQALAAGGAVARAPGNETAAAAAARRKKRSRKRSNKGPRRPSGKNKARSGSGSTARPANRDRDRGAGSSTLPRRRGGSETSGKTAAFSNFTVTNDDGPPSLPSGKPSAAELDNIRREAGLGGRDEGDASTMPLRLGAGGPTMAGPDLSELKTRMKRAGSRPSPPKRAPPVPGGRPTLDAAGDGGDDGAEETQTMTITPAMRAKARPGPKRAGTVTRIAPKKRPSLKRPRGSKPKVKPKKTEGVRRTKPAVIKGHRPNKSNSDAALKRSTSTEDLKRTNTGTVMVGRKPRAGGAISGESGGVGANGEVRKLFKSKSMGKRGPKQRGGLPAFNMAGGGAAKPGKKDAQPPPPDGPPPPLFPPPPPLPKFKLQLTDDELGGATEGGGGSGARRPSAGPKGMTRRKSKSSKGKPKPRPKDRPKAPKKTAPRPPPKKSPAKRFNAPPLPSGKPGMAGFPPEPVPTSPDAGRPKARPRPPKLAGGVPPLPPAFEPPPPPTEIPPPPGGNNDEAGGSRKKRAPPPLPSQKPAFDLDVNPLRMSVLVPSLATDDVFDARRASRMSDFDGLNFAEDPYDFDIDP